MTVTSSNVTDVMTQLLQYVTDSDLEIGCHCDEDSRV